MKPILSICCLILLSQAATANADIRAPQPAQSAKVVLRTNLDVIPETNGSHARLQISQSDLQALRAALDDSPGTPAVAAGFSPSPGRTRSGERLGW